MTTHNTMREALKDLIKAYVRLLQSGKDRIESLGGQCDPVDIMEQADPYLRKARAALAQPAQADESAAVLRERDECAKLMLAMRDKSRNSLFRSALTCAEGAIRARGQVKQPAQAEAQSGEPMLPEFYAELEYNTPDWDVLVSVYRRVPDAPPLLVHQEKLKSQQPTPAHSGDGERAELISRLKKIDPASDNLADIAALERAIEILAQPSQAGGEAWDNGEGWEALAWHLCAEENGEDACNELVWEGGPIREPWGDRWMKYEPEAKRMIDLVRRFTKPQPAAVALTEEQIISIDETTPTDANGVHPPIDFARAVITKFCEVNGITAPEVKK